MSSFETLFSPFRFQGRVAGKTAVGILNTGIDVANLFQDIDDQFKPVDLDQDVYDTIIRTTANTVGDALNPNRGAQAKAILTSMTRAPESSFEEMTEDGATFLLGFLGGRKVIQGAVGATARGIQASRVGKFGIDLGAGAASAFILEDPEADRLVNFIPEEHRPAFIDYLAYDPDADESRLEGRLKNALVDMGLGTLADGAFGLIVKGLQQTRRAVHIGGAGDPEVAAKLAKDTLGVDVTPKPPEMPPEIPLTTKAFEQGIKVDLSESAQAGARKGFSAEKELEAFKAFLRIGPQEKDLATGVEQAFNHLHFDYANTVNTADTLAKALNAASDTFKKADVQTWDDLRKASNDVLPKGLQKSFESIAEITGMTAKEINEAGPKVHLIRRMYDESASQLETLKDRYLQASSKKQDEIAKEVLQRMQTHLMLSDGLNQLGTGAGRLLRSFAAKATGDLGAFETPVTRLLNERVAKEGSQSLPKGIKEGSLTERVHKALGAEDSAQGVSQALKEATKDELREMMKIIGSFDMKDTKAWLKGQKLEKGTALKALETLRKIKMMNILSGVPTLVVNNMSNAASVLFRKGFEDLIASAVPVSSPDRMRFLGEVKGMRALLQQTLGLFSDLFTGTAKGIKAGKPVSEVMAELAVDDISRLREERVALNSLVNSDTLWAKVINGYGKVAHALSFGHMEFSDMVAKQALFAGEAKAIANGKGILKGLKGRQLVDYENTMTEQSIFLARKGRAGAKHLVNSLVAQGRSMDDAVKHLQELTEMVDQGRAVAKDGVFQSEISSETLRAIENALNKNNAGMHLLKTMVFPFYRTPVKIVEFAIERTPILQAASRKWRADLLGVNGGRAKQRAIAKMFTGSAMYSGAFYLAQNNLITGKHAPEERAALLAAGIPEYSMKIPHTDKYIQYSRTDPFAMFLGISADLNKLVENDQLDAGTAMAAMMNATTNNVLNKTFMKGLSDSLKAANNPAEFGAYYTDSQVRAIVSPLSSFQRTFEKVWNANSEEYRKQKPDPALTELRGWVDVLLGDTGLTETRPYDLSDALGNKIERGSLWSELTGMRTSEVDESPSMRELALHKRFPKNRELTFDTGFKMTQEEFLEFKEILGSDVKVRERMDRLVRTRKYQRASTDNQAKMLDRVIRDARGMAKAIMLRRNPELKSQVREHKRNRLSGNLRSLERSMGVPTLDEILENPRTDIERGGIFE